MIFKRKKQEGTPKTEDVLLEIKKDRRILSHVPDKTNVRSNVDRRGTRKTEDLDINDFIEQKQSGIRYKIDYDVEIHCTLKEK